VPLPEFGSLAGSGTLSPFDFSQIYQQTAAAADQASIIGPQGFGSSQFLPVDQTLPYTIRFENPSTAPTAVGEVRIVNQLDPHLDPRTFRLGDLKIGDIQVHVPTGRASFQGDFDFSRSKGFILRVSAGVDVQAATSTWLLQAIDPATGEVIQDP